MQAQPKKTIKLITKLLLIIIVVMLQTTLTTTQAQATDINSIKCENLNTNTNKNTNTDTDKNKNDKDKDKDENDKDENDKDENNTDENTNLKDILITIIEEPIGKTNTTQTTNTGNFRVLNCFRKTEIDATNHKTTTKYSDTCTPEENKVKCDFVQVYLSTSGMSLLFGYIGIIYKWFATIVGTIAVLYLIIGGLMWTTAGDSSENIDKAKEKIIQSITGLVILFLIGIILYTLNPTFFQI